MTSSVYVKFGQLIVSTRHRTHTDAHTLMLLYTETILFFSLTFYTQYDCEYGVELSSVQLSLLHRFRIVLLYHHEDTFVHRDTIQSLNGSYCVSVCQMNFNKFENYRPGSMRTYFICMSQTLLIISIDFPKFNRCPSHSSSPTMFALRWSETTKQNIQNHPNRMLSSILVSLFHPFSLVILACSQFYFWYNQISMHFQCSHFKWQFN